MALSDLGRWVQVEAPRESPRLEAKAAARDDDDDDDDDRGVPLYQSIYETALRNKVPKPVVEDLIRIYAYDVDFQKKVRAGDAFDVLYAEDAAAEGRSEVLFASLTVAGETRHYYRFLTTDDQVVDYYDESAKSAKKFLMRKPMEGGVLRSGFGPRRHPILGYTKMHTGVDWAAPHGTPIYASGNGMVEKAGWESGYGKYVRLRHNNGYESAYGHMSGFARGITEGARVRQGQLIGFVGSTGLSTGPHLHYEVIVNEPHRRSAARQAAPRPLARRQVPGRVRARARAHRPDAEHGRQSRPRRRDAGPAQLSGCGPLRCQTLPNNSAPQSWRSSKILISMRRHAAAFLPRRKTTRGGPEMRISQ